MVISGDHIGHPQRHRAEVDRTAGELPRPRDAARRTAEPERHRVLRDDQDTEGCDHEAKRRNATAFQRPVNGLVNQPARDARRHQRGRHDEAELPGTRNGEQHVRSEDEDRAVREVQDASEADDKRQPHRADGVHGAKPDADGQQRQELAEHPGALLPRFARA
jgi:hypothetical protein